MRLVPPELFPLVAHRTRIMSVGRGFDAEGRTGTKEDPEERRERVRAPLVLGFERVDYLALHTEGSSRRFETGVEEREALVGRETEVFFFPRRRIEVLGEDSHRFRNKKAYLSKR